MTIDWKSHFDHIYCFHLVHQKGRLEGLETEFERVGILRSGIFSYVYTSPDPWERKLLQCVKGAGTRFGEKFLNLGLATARTYREALGRGFKRVLMLEDDIRFLKDTEHIEKILKLSPPPDKSHIVLYDKFLPWSMTNERWTELSKAQSINECFMCKDKIAMYSGACFSITDDGMKMMLRYFYDEHPTASDSLFNKLPFIIAASKINMAIQIFCSDAMAKEYLAGKGNTHYRAYSAMNLDYSQYNIPEEYNPKSGEQKV